MNWTLIGIIGYVVIFLLSLVGASVVVFITFIVAAALSDRRREPDMQEPITQVRVTVPRRQDVPQAFYKAFE